MKITKIASGNGTLYRIEDVSDNYVVLNPEEALLALQFLYEELDTLTRLVNDLPGEPLLQACKYCGGHHPTGTIEQCPLKPKTFLQQTQPDETTRFRASWVDDLEM